MYVVCIDIRSCKKVLVDNRVEPSCNKKQFFITQTTPPPPRRFSNPHIRPLDNPAPLFLSESSSASPGHPSSSASLTPNQHQSSSIFALDYWALGLTAARCVWEEAMASCRHS